MIVKNRLTIENSNSSLMKINKAYYESITLGQINYAIREYFQVKNMVVSVLSSKPPSIKVLKQICEKMPKGRKTRKNIRPLE